MDTKTFKGAAASGTSIAGAIAATLSLIGMWVPVISSGAPITGDLITQSMGVLTLWLTLVFARRAIAKSGPTL